MCPLLRAVALLLVFPLGNTFVLHPLPEHTADRGEHEVRRILLESLNLRQEPRVFMSRIGLLRDQWKNAYKSSAATSAGHSPLPEDSGNATCCTHSSQVFIRDLGWDGWVVYPESVTFVRCSPCRPAGDGASPQCCKPSAHDVVPFVYVDEWSSLVLSSASLTRECGCDPAEEPLDPEVVTPP